MSPQRKRPTKTAPSSPQPDVTEKQDPGHSEADFMRDLARATSNKARKRLAAPARRG
jgi:hypothetical protein